VVLLLAAATAQALLFAGLQVAFWRSVRADPRTLVHASNELSAWPGWTAAARRAAASAPGGATVLFVAPEPETEEISFAYLTAVYALFPRPIVRVPVGELRPAGLAALEAETPAILFRLPDPALPGLERHPSDGDYRVLTVGELRALPWR